MRVEARWSRTCGPPCGHEGRKTSAHCGPTWQQGSRCARTTHDLGRRKVPGPPHACARRARARAAARERTHRRFVWISRESSFERDVYLPMSVFFTLI